MGKPRLTAMATVLMAVALYGCSAGDLTGNGSGGGSADDAWTGLLHATKNPADWVTYGGTFDEQRFSRLTAINDKTVARLGTAWSFEFDTNRAQESTPLEYQGVIYVTTAWSKVYALDAKSGKQLWFYDPQVPGEYGAKGCCDVGNRGAAIYDGKLYFGTFDGRLIALDLKSGKPAWSVVTVDQSKTYTITGAPRIVKGKVVIGNGGAELGVRGYVTAYDAQTGKQAWRFYTVPGNPADGPDNAASDPALKDKAGKTWFGEYWKNGGGGTVWDSIVYDAELDQLYIGVGNGSPWNHKVRSQGKGDNLFLSSIVALDPDTGAYLWHYQGTPGETWDYTHTQTITLATLPVDGKPRKVLMQAPKNGFFYVIDRQSGKLLSAKNYVDVNWASGYDIKTGRPIEKPEARYPKGPVVVTPRRTGGAHNWQPMAFSPQTGLAYVPGNHALFGYENAGDFQRRDGRWNLGIKSDDTSPPDDPKAVAGISQDAERPADRLGPGAPEGSLGFRLSRTVERWRADHRREPGVSGRYAGQLQGIRGRQRQSAVERQCRHPDHGRADNLCLGQRSVCGGSGRLRRRLCADIIVQRRSGAASQRPYFSCSGWMRRAPCRRSKRSWPGPPTRRQKCSRLLKSPMAATFTSAIAGCAMAPARFRAGWCRTCGARAR
ncbi:PQQ-dependent dehydrogenase, methanol/ethanol family [Novosphingobium colocasiae]